MLKLHDFCNRAVNATYSYDPLDRRVSKTVNGVVTKYLWAGQNIVAEYDDEDTLLRRYVHGAGVDEPVAQIEYSPGTGTTYFHQDHLGTVVAVTDDGGDLVDTFSYSTHGEVGSEGGEGAIWRFAGRQYDKETQLYYNRARMYSPAVGRFLQTDPAGDVDSLNLYQYALWDPIMNKDPSGNDALRVDHEGGGITIMIPILFTGPGATPANVQALINGMNSVQGLNSNQRIMAFPTDRAIQGVLNVLDMTPGNDPNCGPAGECVYRLGGYMGHINSALVGDANAGRHEIPHFAGIKDQYGETNQPGEPRTTAPYRGYENNLMGVRNGNLLTPGQFNEALRNSSTKKLHDTGGSGWFGRLGSSKDKY